MMSSITGRRKFQTAELRSRKNVLSSMPTRRSPSARAPGGAGGAADAGRALPGRTPPDVEPLAVRADQVQGLVEVQ